MTLRGGVAFVVVLFVACSSSHSGTSASSNPIPASNSPALAALLLTTADLHTVSDLPSDAVITPPSGGGLAANPDPRGSCGAKIPFPVATEAAAEAIRYSGGVAFEEILRLDPSVARSYADAQIRDAKEGCPSFDSKTDTGATQHVKLTSLVDVGPIADQALAARSDVTVQGQTVAATSILLRRDGLVALVGVLGDSLLEPSVRALAAAAAAHL